MALEIPMEERVVKMSKPKESTFHVPGTAKGWV